MIHRPFNIFQPHENRMLVRLYERSDDLRSTEDIRRFEVVPIADAKQPHGPQTVRVRNACTAPEADGLVTDTSTLVLAIRGADCQIFAVYDPRHHCGGVLHAGWKGLLNGAITGFVETLQKEWGSDPRDLLIGAGPSLCFTCSEFTDPARELTGIDHRFFQGRLADLRAIADDQWQRAGVHARNIERHADCTKCNRTRWWSLRGGDKEALRTGSRNVLTFSLR